MAMDAVPVTSRRKQACLPLKVIQDTLILGRAWHERNRQLTISIRDQTICRSHRMAHEVSRNVSPHLCTMFDKLVSIRRTAAHSATWRVIIDAPAGSSTF
jgi:hypothetical protein